MKILGLLVICIFFGVNANANNVNVKLSILNSGETYKILATDGTMGIIQLDFETGDHCVGTFNLNESYGSSNLKGHLNIYFPGIGQEMYSGNCHNFSLSIDFKSKRPWNLEIGEELETTYVGVRSFGFEREITIKRQE